MDDVPTGLEKITAQVERARGARAPQLPVQFDTADPNAWRADDPRWTEPDMPEEPRRDRFWRRFGGALICPGCLSLRFGPGHLSRRFLFGIDCRNGY